MPRRRELHDPYFRKAKAEGYAARSAYKLLQIQEKRRVLRPGDWVLDLGCAPGSWLQVASEVVGPRGRVVGIDLQPVTIDPGPNVRTMVGDAFKVQPFDLLRVVNGPGPSNPESASAAPTPERFDVVLSDMAPNTTGTPQGDHFRSVALCERVVELLPSVLRTGGGLVMKVFEGEQYPLLLRRLERLFGECKGIRPDATRDVSREMFIVAAGFAGHGPGAGSAKPASGDSA